MNKSILSFLIAVCAANTFCLFFPAIGFSQDSSFQYGGYFNKVMAGNLCADDFTTGSVFLTLDTIDALAPSIFLETTDPDEVIKSFKNYLTTFFHDNKMFYYVELNKSCFHSGRNIIMGSLNTATNTYRLNLWMDKKRPNLIEGITVYKFSTKFEPGGVLLDIEH